MTSYGWVLPYRSVIETSDDPETLSAKMESDMVGLARRAENKGFESLWVGDRVLEFWRPEPMVMLSAVATATDSADIGVAIHIPFLRHPVHVAHQTATLDQISGGRFQLGVGVGADDVKRSMGQLDIPTERRGARLNESLDIIQELWTGDPVSYEGEFYSLSDATIDFGPTRQPPIYIGSGIWDSVDAFPEPVLDRIVEYGDGWIPLKTSAEKYANAWPEIQTHLTDVGRDSDSVDPAVYLDVVIGDAEEAIAEAQEYLETYYQGRIESPSKQEIRSWGTMGPRDHVAQKLGEFKDAGVETFVLRSATLRQNRDQLRKLASLIDDL